MPTVLTRVSPGLPTTIPVSRTGSAQAPVAHPSRFPVDRTHQLWEFLILGACGFVSSFVVV